MKKIVVFIIAMCMAFVPLTDGAAVPHDVMHTRLLETGRLGTGGRLVIKQHSVALFWSDEVEGPNAQTLVDSRDSAAIYAWHNNQSPIIADHRNQGFDVLKTCEVGDLCYIVDEEDYQTYICVDIDDGAVNEIVDMYLSDGTNFSRENDPGYLYMYTCRDPGDSYHIVVVKWQPVE